MNRCCASIARLIERTGGAQGMRDAGLVESAIQRASAGYGAVELYATVERKAAAVCAGLAGNHGYVDGNKRIGVVVMLLVLARNDIRLAYSQRELVDLGLDAAMGKCDVNAIAEWIGRHER